jgi:hypothetical protein
MQVVNAEGARYTVRNLVTNKLEDYHITSLREFKYDERYVDPRTIAMCDEQFYEVERILQHKGQFNKKDTLYFKVKWYQKSRKSNVFFLSSHKSC